VGAHAGQGRAESQAGGQDKESLSRSSKPKHTSSTIIVVVVVLVAEETSAASLFVAIY